MHPADRRKHKNIMPKTTTEDIEHCRSLAKAGRIAEAKDYALRSDSFLAGKLADCGVLDPTDADFACRCCAEGTPRAMASFLKRHFAGLLEFPHALFELCDSFAQNGAAGRLSILAPYAAACPHGSTYTASFAETACKNGKLECLVALAPYLHEHHAYTVIASCLHSENLALFDWAVARWPEEFENHKNLFAEFSAQHDNLEALKRCANAGSQCAADVAQTALEHRSERCALWLLEQGKLDLNDKDIREFAARSGILPLCTEIIRIGCDPRQAIELGLQAAATGHFEAADFFLDHTDPRLVASYAKAFRTEMFGEGEDKETIELTEKMVGALEQRLLRISINSEPAACKSPKSI